MQLENLSFIKAMDGLGEMCCYEATANNTDLLKVIKENNDEIESQLLKFGGIVFRGFAIRSVSEFNKLANAMSPHLFDYVNRSTPRHKLGGKIYTATEYPADRRIPFHNENAYTLSWPNKIFFYSAIAADSGGETATADSRYVFKKIDQEIVNKFNDKKVLYVRKFVSGIDLSWQETFQTNSREEVERYCQENSIMYEWPDNQESVELITKQVCQATIKHPVTNEDVWFNQAHLFHISSLEESDRRVLKEALGENTFPRNAYYGDGSEIALEDLEKIIAAYETEKIEFQWQKSDVMVLDNRLMAHSRNPFAGERKVVVAMGE